MHRRTLYENMDSAKIKVPFIRQISIFYAWHRCIVSSYIVSIYQSISMNRYTPNNYAHFPQMCSYFHINLCLICRWAEGDQAGYFQSAIWAAGGEISGHRRALTPHTETQWQTKPATCPSTLTQINGEVIHIQRPHWLVSFIYVKYFILFPFNMQRSWALSEQWQMRAYMIHFSFKLLLTTR